MNKLYVKILTTEGTLFEDDVSSLKVMTVKGSMGIMANHAPITAILNMGELIIQKEKDEKIIPFFVSDGIIEVSKNRATILTTRCQCLAKFDAEAWQKEVYFISMKVAEGQKTLFYQQLLKEALLKKEIVEKYSNNCNKCY